MLSVTEKEKEQLSQSELRTRWRELLPAAEGLAKGAKVLHQAARRLSSTEGYEALKKVQKDLEKLQALSLPTEETLRRAQEAAHQVQQWLDNEWERRAREFSEELVRFFEERHVPAHREGMSIFAGTLEIAVVAAKDMARVLYLGEEVEKAPLTCEKVFKAWQKARERLEKDHTSPQTLLGLLETAYDEQCRLQGKSAGTRVRLSDLHFQLFVLRQTPQVRQDPRKTRCKEYPRYQFAYDLSMLVERGLEISWHGRQLVFHQASKTAAGSRASSVMVELGGEVAALSDLEMSS